MYKLVEWNENLDLKDFYLKAKIRGFENNCSQKVMIDCFRNEREWNAWILYQNDEAVGSVAAHSFDEFLPGSYRILTRVLQMKVKKPVNGWFIGIIFLH